MKSSAIALSVFAAGLFALTGCSGSETPDETGASQPPAASAPAESAPAEGAPASSAPAESAPASEEPAGDGGGAGHSLDLGTYDATITFTLDGKSVDVPESQCAVVSNTVAIGPKDTADGGVSVIIREEKVTFAMSGDRTLLGKDMTLDASGNTFTITGKASEPGKGEQDVDFKAVCE